MPNRYQYEHPTAKNVSKEGLQAFADRIYQRMTELGLRQADLAEAVFGLNPDGTIKGRGKISLYLAGRGVPGEPKMRALAEVLKMPVAQLAPKVDITPLVRQELRPKQPSANPVPFSDYATVSLKNNGMVELTKLLPNGLRKAVLQYTKQRLEKRRHEELVDAAED